MVGGRQTSVLSPKVIKAKMRHKSRTIMHRATFSLQAACTRSSCIRPHLLKAQDGIMQVNSLVSSGHQEYQGTFSLPSTPIPLKSYSLKPPSRVLDRLAILLRDLDRSGRTKDRCLPPATLLLERLPVARLSVEPWVRPPGEYGFVDCPILGEAVSIKLRARQVGLEGWKPY